MSTLKATNIKNESSASNNIVLDSGGGVVVSGVTTFSSAVNFSGSGDITLGTGTTISSPASDTFTVSTNGSERVRVDSSGRLAIGTTSPVAPLHVSGAELRLQNDTKFEIGFRGSSASTSLAFRDAFAGTDRMTIDSSGRLLVGTSSATANSSLVLEGHSGNGLAQSIVYLKRGNTPGAANSFLGIVNFSNVTEGVGAEIRADSDAAWVTTPGSESYPGRLVFSTTADGASSPTERMRITSSGLQRFFSSAAVGHVSQSSAAAGTSSSIYYGSYGATDNQGTSAINSFTVWTNGNVQNTNNSYTALSDIKLKENIVNAGSQWDDLKAFQVRKYNLKEGQTHTQIGLIAQEVELVSPGLVYESPDRDAEGNDLGTVTKSVNYSVLYMKAVKALQEAMERIETLEAKVAALESA